MIIQNFTLFRELSEDPEPISPPFETPTGDNWSETITVECGWPFRCLGGSSHIFFDRTPPPRSIFKSPGIAWLAEKTTNSPGLFLPYRPLPIGLAANTLIYSAATLTCLRVARFVRASLRKRRCRCTDCGYDRSGLASADSCPECGACTS